MSQEIINFNSGTGDIEVNFDADNETVWLSLQKISELFGRDKSVISRHLKNIYDSNIIPQEILTVSFKI